MSVSECNWVISRITHQHQSHLEFISFFFQDQKLFFLIAVVRLMFRIQYCCISVYSLLRHVTQLHKTAQSRIVNLMKWRKYAKKYLIVKINGMLPNAS
jgi:hypothetical protein